MIQDILVIVSCMFTLIGLNGIFTNLKNRISPPKDPLPPDATLPLPEDPHKKEFPGFNARAVKAASEQFLVILAEPSWQGVAAFATAIATALVAGLIALFIDLPDPVLAALGLVSLAATGLSAETLRRRSIAGSWLPPDILGKKEVTAVPVPDKRPEPPVPEVELSPAELPGTASLATLERYWVFEPYAYIRIERVSNEGFTYIVVEPPISLKEKTILMETYAHLRDIIIYDDVEKKKDERIDPVAVAKIIREFDPDITEDRVAILTYYIKRDLTGYGPLDVLMRDPALEDLSCNGHDLPVFIFHRAYGSLPTSIHFSEAELNQFVLKLAQKANKQISLSNPMVDATLPNGARVQITYSEVVSTKGSSFTIRKFRAEPMTPLDLIRYGTYNAEILAFLWLAIEHRKSLLVVGGTASGKTSMMNAVSLFIPQNAKIVSLEDTREIQLPHKNWLPTQTREIAAEGLKGDIDLFSLLKACMRQRPEYIIVGEVRGKEAQTLFQAMNSGHSTLSTIHAGSVYEAINRLTHDPINVPPVMFQALDLVVVQSIYTLGKTRIRRCLSIHEIEVDKHGEINPILLYDWDIQKDTFPKRYEKSKVLTEISFHCGWDELELEHQLKKREEFFSWALEVEPPSLRDLANAIHDMGD
ncbi:MAG: type II/IV secretion system ATPase subunit [Methanoregula sp.]|jgi:flagellar protein FlaI|uniref:type II/IV secretion system ATPase subunit n=1 Tax=Methanoregula sp. TaxID=2052170 RepID=UPI0025E05461|nr:type II/IV secretion system ATPase subunit [Methanoregula sp.]MCK9630630.1 type II/IV secretion system ATPase subunit [Methanoregula sp.]